MQPNDASITVTFQDVDVPSAVAAIRRMNDMFDRLWAGGRLRSVMQAYEGSEAVRSFTSIFLTAMRQLNEADGAGRATTTLVMRAPAAGRQSLIAFARQLLDLMADDATMRSIGAEPMTTEESAFIMGFVDRAEGALSAGDPA